MYRKHSILVTASLFSLVIGAAAHSVAPGNSDMLQTLERGLWKFSSVRSGTSSVASNQLCLGDPRLLAQVQHGATTCSQYVVKSAGDSLTISYSCKGAGQGLTTIRKESSRLIQIESQGIKNNAPFSIAVEGRRAGAC